MTTLQTTMHNLWMHLWNDDDDDDDYRNQTAVETATQQSATES